MEEEDNDEQGEEEDDDDVKEKIDDLVQGDWERLWIVISLWRS